MAPRNPNWTRDELILALDLYFRVNPLHTSEKNPKVKDLSNLLNRLPIHIARPEEETFRNPNGVYMKLCSFLRLDPGYSGKGLSAGSKLDQEVWKDFASDRDRLARTAWAIRANSKHFPFKAEGLKAIDREEEEFVEGKILTALHRLHERNRKAVGNKKRSVLESTGALACEICGFDFSQVYGDIGEGFAECHHRPALSDLRYGVKTRLSDLAIVCSNCHRMLHQTRPWMTIERLRKLVVAKAGASPGRAKA